jgi:RNA polymerase sigma-70 factor (ECF subfamily)
MNAMIATLEDVSWTNLALPCPAREAFPAVSAPVTPTLESRSGRSATDGDAAWIARIRAGDEDAARALVERLYPTVIKMVRSHLPRRTSEEDLAQAIFAKVFKHLGQFSCLVPLEHWVSRIAINTCMHQLRHELCRPELRMGDLSEEENAVINNLASTTADLPGDQGAAAREMLEQLLVRLKPDERVVITLLHLEERSVGEISRVTGWSVSRVKVKAFRARQKLRKLWKTLLHSERC